VGVLSLVPKEWWIGALVALLVGGLFFGAGMAGYRRGAHSVQVKWDMEHAAQAKRIAELEARNAEVVTKTVIEYRDRIQVVREKGEEIVREVTRYVPSDACPLPAGFRVLHDAAARGEPPEDPVGAIAAAAPVEAAAAAETVAANYQSCRETAERMIALQKLVQGVTP